MKTKTISSFLVLFAIVAGIVASTPAAFADHSEVTIVTADGSGAPGCEETADGCFLPTTATVDVGGVVIMSNTDTAAHTFTSGDLADSDSVGNLFDTSLLMAGGSYEYSPDTVGEIPYFCMVHPWMQGVIIVQEAGADDDEAMHDDAELMVTITDSAVLGGTQVDLEFSELHVNYEITATQNGETVLQETAHSMELTASHQIDAVGSDESPIDIDIVSLGIGPPGDEANWTGPTGSVATTQVVPEFGTIAMMILVVAIISIVAVTAKSRVVPRF
ncbi:MAG: PEFG-CTERM sorting domain-containing protein [Nitrosopumilus sp.]|nr:PEFG-CTERM sorting domain-containing protein [Nitrosopumilus sp.]MDC4231143.1 PEFG-CTERM sorting domain-containing protein [Nitrosopumilus sp.]